MGPIAGIPRVIVTISTTALGCSSTGISWATVSIRFKPRPTEWSSAAPRSGSRPSGKEFLKDVGKHAQLENFPNTGTDLIVAWQQSLRNFTIARLDNLAPRIASIDAIGDSISKAVNARENTQGSCTNRDQESFNWSTSITQDETFCSDGGDRVYSQAERLECRQETMIVNTDPNSAVSGAEMLKIFSIKQRTQRNLSGRNRLHAM